MPRWSEMLLLLLLLCKTLRQVTFFPGPQHQQHQAVVERKGPVIVLSDTAELGTRCTELKVWRSWQGLSQAGAG